jgi:predicted O-methyltransferase YrrM
MEFEDFNFLFGFNDKPFYDNRDRGILRMNYNEAKLLWDCVKQSRGTILEIGRRHGGSTVLLVGATNSNRKVISIDIAPKHHEIPEKYFADTEFSKNLELIVDDASKIKTEDLGMLFIDGDHSYEGVTRDINSHWDSVVIDGLVVFHDAVPNDGLKYANKINHCQGVTQACYELVNAGKGEELHKAGSVLVLKKLK